MGRILLAVVAAACLAGLAAPASQAKAQDDFTVVEAGRFAPGDLDWRYVPVEVPKGVRELYVRYDYGGRPGNALDIALFDEDGYGLGNDAGFRGSSGGGASEFWLSASWASDGYLPGPIEAGTWHVALGPYRVGAQGLDWRVTVTMRFGKPGASYRPRPAPQVVNRQRGWYRGDTHVHTDHSGGVDFPLAGLLAEARARGLDWFASTDYYTPRAHWEWGREDTDGLLVLNGSEAVTRHGHWNPIGVSPGNFVDYRFRPTDGVLGRIVGEVRADGALAIANHPFTDCGACSWQFPFGPMDAIELWNGAWGTDEERALALWRGLLEGGQGKPIVGASDGRGTFSNPLGTAQTVVRADGLSRQAVVRGIARGRSYVAGSSAVTLGFTALAGRRRADIGDRLTVRDGDVVDLSLRVQGVPDGEVSFHTQAGEVHRARVAGDDATVRHRLDVDGAELVRAEVRDADGAMAALTNPIHLGRPALAKPLAQVGTPDGSALDLALAPDGHLRYPEAFPDDVTVTAGSDDAERRFSYVQPGPADAWAGRGEHPFRVRFRLDRVPRREVRLVAWVLDSSPAEPGSLAVALNGGPRQVEQLPKGGGDGLHWGDGALLAAGIRPRAIQVTLPREALRRGDNEVILTRPDGSWLVYDALGITTDR